MDFEEKNGSGKIEVEGKWITSNINSLLYLVASLFLLMVALFFFLALFSLAESKAGEVKHQGMAGKPWIMEKKTISRTADSVVITGEKLRRSLHFPIDRLALFASHSEGIKPIPFQVDEVNNAGERVLPQIPPTLRDKKEEFERDDEEGILDENDELVFMIRDAGDRIRLEFYPAGRMEEITLIDPATGGKAWVYLGVFDSDPPRSRDNYVRYLFPENLIRSTDYEAGFYPQMAFCPGSLSLWGSGNILDKMKIRFDLQTLGATYSLNETQFDSELAFYKEGPVRVVRRVKNAIKLSEKFRTPSAAIENIYYDNSIILPISVQVPISMKVIGKLISSMRLSGSVDMYNLDGWKVKVSSDPTWFRVDGKMDYFEAHAQTEGATWFVVAGPRGALLYRILLDRRPDGSRYNQPIETSLLYVDDDQLPDPPENVPGQSPNIGFWIKRLEDLSKGMLYFYAVMYMIPNYREGDEEEYLKILDRPLQVWVN